MGWFRRSDRKPPNHKPTVERNTTVVSQLQRLVKELEEIDKDLHSVIDKGKGRDVKG